MASALENRKMLFEICVNLKKKMTISKSRNVHVCVVGSTGNINH